MGNNGRYMIEKILKEVGKVVHGKDASMELMMNTIIAGGHVLIEDIPGVGKTTIATAFSRAMRLKHNRVQFTPDILPSDIMGFSMYDKEQSKFVYQPGAVMCNVFLADEINRTSSKTQSALLEVMEEGTVTVDGETRKVPAPFFVMATQNPIGSAGTQMLPESQLDRFMVCMSMGYPDAKSEAEIIKGNAGRSAIDTITPVANSDDIAMMQKEASEIFAKDSIYEYMVKLATATRNHQMVELGVSPRGTIALCRMAKARAYMKGRDYLIPEDVKEVAVPVMAHRLILTGSARMDGMTAEKVIKNVLVTVPAPSINS
ncbi:MAG: AAA family ATPase [Bacteroides sp.]